MSFGTEMARLMQANSIGVNQLARMTGYTASHISQLRSGKRNPSPDAAQDIDQALGGDGVLAALVPPPSRMPGESPAVQQRPEVPDAPGDILTDARSVAGWLAGTNTTDDVIEEMDRATAYLAEVHAHVPARKVLGDVLALNREAQTLLQGGRQRLSQTRDLLQIDARLMAHASLLFGDLGDVNSAREYGTTALLLAQEAGADEAIAWSVQAKTARWAGGFVAAAEFARRGFEVSGPSATKVELAYREANAIALFGDAVRARGALLRAERASERLHADRAGISVWSFPPGRQAIFSISIALHTGDAQGALRAARAAEARWSSGDPKVPATWAQVRAGAAMAYLMLGSLDGAAAQIAPVLNMPPEMRINTVTGYLKDLDRMLRHARFEGNVVAGDLRDQIREFNSAPAA
jgi:transcriptional regulator with XRE-family HTH domain